MTAAFVGHKVAGFSGALVTTFGIFSPSLLLVMALAEFQQKLSTNLWVKAALKGVVAAFTGMIAILAVRLASYSLTDALAVVIAVAAFILLCTDKLATVWVVLFGSVGYWLIKMMLM